MIKQRTADSEDFSIEALQQGDKHEFARLVETYSGLVFRLAYKMMENEQDAEDILQETFLKAYRGIQSFDGRSKISSWLYRIAVNESLMILRKKRQPVFSIDEASDPSDESTEPQQIADWCCLPEEELMSDEARTHLDHAVEELPPSLKIVFILRDLEGLSTAETGEVLNLSETAVKTRLSRARLRLREKLTGYFKEYSLGRIPYNETQPVENEGI
jgi:RNA polymerase sigma-70 factor (ECF subfamily)